MTGGLAHPRYQSSSSCTCDAVWSSPAFYCVASERSFVDDGFLGERTPLFSSAQHKLVNLCSYPQRATAALFSALCATALNSSSGPPPDLRPQSRSPTASAGYLDLYLSTMITSQSQLADNTFLAYCTAQVAHHCSRCHGVAQSAGIHRARKMKSVGLSRRPAGRLWASYRGGRACSTTPR
jgi:hypothetical protein